MACKTILVHVDAGKRCPARIEVAIGLARRYTKDTEDTKETYNKNNALQ